MDIQLQKPLKILLIGESCLDEYKMGTVTRISPEAPVPVIHHQDTIRKDGMAANVKNNLEALGCDVTFLTNDNRELIKRRFVDIKSHQQLLRQDVGDSVKPLDISTIEVIDKTEFDAVVLSDYNKGLLTDNTISYICKRFRGQVYVDTKRPDLNAFVYAYIKLNEQENSLSFNQPSNSTKIVTLGSEGSVCEGVHYPSENVQVHDVTGAGDVFLAALAVFGSTDMIQTGIKAATALASKSVEYFGTHTLTDKDLEDSGWKISK